MLMMMEKALAILYKQIGRTKGAQQIFEAQQGFLIDKRTYYSATPKMRLGCPQRSWWLWGKLRCNY